MIKKLWDFGWGMYKKHEEGINYLIFGFLAFVLNYILYFIFADAVSLHYMVATVLSWVLTFVFKSQNKAAASVVREFVSFIGARVATEVLEIALMYVMVDICSINDKISKLVCQTIVILANYVLSKIWIFKDTSKKEE